MFGKKFAMYFEDSRWGSVLQFRGCKHSARALVVSYQHVTWSFDLAVDMLNSAY